MDDLGHILRASVVLQRHGREAVILLGPATDPLHSPQLTLYLSLTCEVVLVAQNMGNRI